MEDTNTLHIFWTNADLVTQADGHEVCLKQHPPQLVEKCHGHRMGCNRQAVC